MPDGPVLEVFARSSQQNGMSQARQASSDSPANFDQRARSSVNNIRLGFNPSRFHCSNRGPNNNRSSSQKGILWVPPSSKPANICRYFPLSVIHRILLSTQREL